MCMLVKELIRRVLMNEICRGRGAAITTHNFHWGGGPLGAGGLSPTGGGPIPGGMPPIGGPGIRIPGGIIPGGGG
jgi:hypothetical protein